MQYEDKKVTLITNELVNLLLTNGSKDVEIQIQRSQTESTITLVDRDCHFDDDLKEYIHSSLKTPRQAELEGYYWQLLGESREEELHLVGAMLDDADVHWDQGEFHIHVTRKNV